MTSRDDPSPIVCLEALALGIPVFAFGTTGYSEILPEEFLCKNTEDMIEKINSYMINQSKWTPEFFSNLAQKHDLSQFHKKLRKWPPKVDVPLPECDHEMIVNSPNLLISKLGKALDEARHSIEENKIRKQNYEENLQWMARKRKEMNAQLEVNKQEQVEEFEKKRKDLELSFNYVKNAHKMARIEVKEKMRLEIQNNLSQEIKSVMIVGNSPSVIEKDNGEFIDSCDVVIRINNFQTKEFEKYVGQKTDFAIFTAASKPNPEINDLPKGGRLLHAANYHSSQKKLQKRLLEANGVGFDLSEVTQLSPTLYFYGLAILMNLPEGSWPSTGSVALQFALDVFIDKKIQIYYTGIDFFKSAGRKIEHYFEHTSLSDGKHTSDLEIEYFDKYIKSGHLIKI